MERCFKFEIKSHLYIIVFCESYTKNVFLSYSILLSFWIKGLFSPAYFQFSSVQFSSVQFNSVQFSSVQFSSNQFSSVQLLTILLLWHITIHFSSVQISSIQFSSIQFSSIQFSSVQFSCFMPKRTGPKCNKSIFHYSHFSLWLRSVIYTQ